MYDLTITPNPKYFPGKIKSHGIHNNEIQKNNQMINSINITDVATFDKNGIKIYDLKKINFIYGDNGTGKTTLSNFLHNPEDKKYDNCSISWNENQKVNSLVYNKDFKERNFGKGKLNGIFTLGKATTEEVNAIEENENILKKIKDEGIKKRQTLKELEEDQNELTSNFKESIWKNVYKRHENYFKEAFTGYRTKEKFKAKILDEFSNNKEKLLEIDTLKEKAKIIFGEIPIMISEVNNFTFHKILEIEKHPIWHKIVVGKGDVDIASLIQKLNITDWVNQGQQYVNEEDDVCPFCQQNTISSNFKKQINSFFDETYLKDIQLIKALKNEYLTLIQNLFNELNFIETTQKNFSKSKLNTDKFSMCFKTLISQQTINNERLVLKEKEPSRTIELISLKEQLLLLSELIENTNEEIKKHNKIVNNYNVEREKLIKSIWRFIIDSYSTDITSFQCNNKRLTIEIEALNNHIDSKIVAYKKLDHEIKKQCKNITSTQPTINEINRLLMLYGFTNFKIVPAKETGYYQIQRDDGSIAETTLSEGEITFLTFLYFLQLTKGGISEETINEERIIVIDDPVSNLDSNMLLVVSSLIKEIIKQIKNDSGNINQLILLTHNIYFHKEVTLFNGSKVCSKTKYWVLRKNESTTSLQSFGLENPIQISYELLWRELKSNEIKSSITIQNIMRKIIENYFKFLGKYEDDDLIQKFKTKEEQEICRSLTCWVNDDDHSINDNLYIELQNKAIVNYQKVFKDLFKLTNHEKHYNMMMNSDGVVEEIEV